MKSHPPHLRPVEDRGDESGSESEQDPVITIHNDRACSSEDGEQAEIAGGAALMDMYAAKIREAILAGRGLDDNQEDYLMLETRKQLGENPDNPKLQVAFNRGVEEVVSYLRVRLKGQPHKRSKREESGL